MTNDEIKAKIEEVKSELTTLQAQLEDKKLHLEVSHKGNLRICYGDKMVGFITPEGRCCILFLSHQREAIEEWMKDGMPVDETVVEWCGGKYKLTDVYRLKRTDLNMFGNIYDFEYKLPCPACEDTNIKRYSNGTPILY